MTITLTITDANVPNLLQAIGYGKLTSDQSSFIQTYLVNHLTQRLNVYNHSVAVQSMLTQWQLAEIQARKGVATL